MSDNILFDIFADAFNTESHSEMMPEDNWKKLKESAEVVKQLYDSYKYAGFTDEQALEFTKSFLSTVYRKAVNE